MSTSKAPLTLNLTKEGVEPPKLRLSLDKGKRFKVRIFWDCKAAHQDDLDCHALATTNHGNGAKLSSLDQILSTHNTKKMSRTGILDVNPDGSFSLANGGLTHSGDKRVQKNEEVITIDGSRLPTEINEIPLFATVYKVDEEHEEEHHGDGEEAAFADIEVVLVTITDDRGNELGKYELSDEFGDFNAVQLGSILYNDDEGWVYVAVGRGFKGNMNDVLGFFS